MLVGRHRWARGMCAVSALLGLGASVVTGCGGRTSALDDIYSTTPGGSGGSFAQGGQAIAGQSTFAGTAPIGGSGGTTGKPKPGTVDPSLAIAPCQKYCPGFGTQCAEMVMGPDCMSACQGEANGFGPTCQKLAIQSLNCLAPFFTPGGSNCPAAVQKGLVKCGKIVDRFEKCKADVSGTTTPTPTPIPTPVPTPVPVPMPVSGFDTSICKPGSVMTADPSCKQDWECPDGTYVVYCSPNNNGTSACGCYKPGGGMSSDIETTQVNACLLATYLCGSSLK